MRKRLALCTFACLALLTSLTPAMAQQDSSQSSSDYQWQDPPHGPITDVGAAPIVVVGTATDVQSFWVSNAKVIRTRATYSVKSKKRGNVPDTITVITDGGHVDEAPSPDGSVLKNVTMRIEHFPTFHKGVRSRLFLTGPTSNGDYILVGGADGKQDDQSTAPDTDPEPPLQLTTNPQDDSIPPSGCGAGYCLAGTEWQIANQPVPYKINPNTVDVAGEETEVKAGFATWENDGPSYIRWNYQGTTAAVGWALDNEMRVYWSPTPTINVGGCAGVNYLACTAVWASGGHIVHFDTEFNDSWAFSIGAVTGKHDIQSVMVHEAGHALGLDHTSDSTQIMYSQLSPNTVKRTLVSGDLAGVRAVYTNHNPRGAGESGSCNQVNGWTYDTDQPEVAIMVHGYIDSSGWVLGATNVLRSDVNASENITGLHGVSWTPPPENIANNQTHTVRLYAIDIPGWASNVSNTNFATWTMGPCARATQHGSLILKEGGGTVYTVHGGQKLPIPGPAILDSYSSRWVDGTNNGFRWDRIMHVLDSVLTATADGSNIGYREGSLIRNPATGNVYIVDKISDSIWQRRLFPTTADLTGCGFSTAWVHDDASITSSAYTDGLNVTSTLCTSAGGRPDGQLVSSPSTGKVYVLETIGGVRKKRYITGPSTMDAGGYNWNTIISVPDLQLATYTDGANILWDEGSLLSDSSDGRVYVVEQPTSDTYVRHYIPNPCTLDANGLFWSDIISASHSDVSLYTAGLDVPNASGC